MDNLQIAYITIALACFIVVVQAVKLYFKDQIIHQLVDADIHEEAVVMDCIAASPTLAQLKETLDLTDKGERRKFYDFCYDINILRQYRNILVLNPDFSERYGHVADEIQKSFDKKNASYGNEE